MIFSFIQIKRDEQERFARQEGALPPVLNVCVTKLNTMRNKLLSELRCQGKHEMKIHCLE